MHAQPILITGALTALVLPAAALASHPAPVATSWSLTGVSPSARYLKITALGGGCFTKPLTIEKTEDARTVTLTVKLRQPVPDTPDEQIACPAFVGFVPGGVLLDRPLAGRRLVGLARVAIGPRPARTPRLIGVNGADALRALANQGVKARLVGARARTVVRQTPKAGAPLPARGVTLVAK